MQHHPLPPTAREQSDPFTSQQVATQRQGVGSFPFRHSTRSVATRPGAGGGALCPHIRVLYQRPRRVFWGS